MVKVYFDSIREIILKELDLATENIAVAVYWFTNHDLLNKLIAKQIEGVKVELIIHNDYINNREKGLNFQRLIDNGGDFYFSNTNNPMHNKFCLIDDKALINGSYNWTYYAEDRNRENILLIKEEKETIKAFLEEFKRLKSSTLKVEKIQPLTSFEVDDYNQLNARDYLANDLVFQARSVGDITLVSEAFEIAPKNIEVQKRAFELNLTKKRKVKNSIGSSLLGDKYLVIVPKDTFIPVTMTAIVQTSANYQVTSECRVLFGENPIASKNQGLSYLKIKGLPRKLAGKAKMKLVFTIDIYGKLRMEKFSLDNGVRAVIYKDIKDLLVE